MTNDSLDAVGAPGAGVSVDPASASPAVTPSFTTPAQVQDLITKSQQQQAQNAQQRAARDTFVGTRMKNFPDAYKRLLGDDPTKWEEEAKAVAASFQADMQKLRLKLPNIGGDTTPGKSPAAIVPQEDKRSAVQRIADGLRKTRN